MMRMARVFCLCLLASACGCLSVVRIPLCNEQVSDEGEVTNRVWSSFCDDVPGMRVYPTVKMRCRVTEEWLKPIPPEAKGKGLREMDNVAIRCRNRHRFSAVGFI